jgi:16S rRNA (adenine1518-N6/adenine1519-N6)-dimethyltransferase
MKQYDTQRQPTRVQPKKQLGQHFLNDQNIARKIVESLLATNTQSVFEIGPGMGVLTSMLLERFGNKFFALEIDREAVAYLKLKYPSLGTNLFEDDVLRFDFNHLPRGNFCLIGNFPYNISSQIFFKVLENRENVTEVVGMVQREVALRICEPPGSRTYGILSVLLQAYYNIEYLFTVSEGVFTPPPKVKSAVIRLTRNSTKALACNEELFVKVVKAGFNQRRKTLRNSIRSGFQGFNSTSPLLNKRAEQLSVTDFVELTNIIEQSM